MAYCMAAYSYVIWEMGKMIQSAIVESADHAQRQGLYFIYYATVVIWSAFAVVWFGQEFGVLSIYQAEVGNMWANFGAKVHCNFRAFHPVPVHDACATAIHAYTALCNRSSSCNSWVLTHEHGTMQLLH